MHKNEKVVDIYKKSGMMTYELHPVAASVVRDAARIGLPEDRKGGMQQCRTGWPGCNGPG